MPSVRISLRHIRRRFLSCTATITLLGLAAEVGDYLWSPTWAEWLVPMISLSYEHNLPTWYVVCLHAISALLCAHRAADARQHGRPHARRWAGLALAFGYISLDELAEIHEAAGGWLGVGGVLYFDWVIPAAAITLLLGLWFLPLVRALPTRTRRRVIVAGTVFVVGALGMELPLGYWTEQAGSDNLVYGLIDWVEETLELTGITLFILALLDYAGTGADSLELTLGAADPQKTEGDNLAGQ